MFNGLTPAITVALVAAFASLAVALIGGGIAVFNTLRTNDNQLDVEAFKADISRDLEHVKAELSHGQLISSRSGIRSLRLIRYSGRRWRGYTLRNQFRNEGI